MSGGGMDSYEPTTFFSLLSTRYMMSCNKSCIIGHGPSIFPIEVRKMKKKFLTLYGSKKVRKHRT